MNDEEKQWGGKRPGAGRPRRYVNIKIPARFGVERSDCEQVTPESDLTICLAEDDDRRGVVIGVGDIWYGAKEALGLAAYVEEHRQWLEQMSVRLQLVAYARQIAQYRQYDDLVNGLQPLARLEDKYQAEVVEFKEALAGKTWLHSLHEASDVLYYAAAIDEQSDGELYSVARRECVQMLRAHGINVTPEQVERAALTKYQFRASGPNVKDETRELALIEAAVVENQ